MGGERSLCVRDHALDLGTDASACGSSGARGLRESAGTDSAGTSMDAVLWHYGLGLRLSLCVDAGTAGGRRGGLWGETLEDRTHVSPAQEEACACWVEEGVEGVSEGRCDGGRGGREEGREEAGVVWWVHAVSSTAAQVGALEANIASFVACFYPGMQWGREARDEAREGARNEARDYVRRSQRGERMHVLDAGAAPLQVRVCVYTCMYTHIHTPTHTHSRPNNLHNPDRCSTQEQHGRAPPSSPSSCASSEAIQTCAHVSPVLSSNAPARRLLPLLRRRRPTNSHRALSRAVSHDSVTVTAALTNTMASAGVSLASLPVRIDTAGTDAQKF